MTSSSFILFVAVFAASAVESVEALTIVLAAGVTRGWRSAIEGVAVAVVVLVVLVAAVGVPLAKLVPIDELRVVIGALLLVLGLDWLRKAILRGGGHKALHDEDAIYARTVSELAVPGPQGGGSPATSPAAATPSWRSGPRDAQGFTVAFKGTFLEGLEVVLIVITLGASSHRLGLAAVAAGCAAVVVAVAGVLVARQLSEVPENAMKLVVGVMLTSFGVFWVGEGAGVDWPGSDAMLLALVAFFALCAVAGIAVLKAILPAARVADPKALVDPAGEAP